MVDAVPTTLLLSKTGFAARRGVGVSAVSKWIERGRLSGEALTPDGRINVEVAERQLGVRLDMVRSAGAIAAARLNERANDVPQGEAEPASLREQILAVDLEQKRRRLAAEKGVHVRADQVRAERGKALTQLIAAEENWVADLEAELSLTPEQVALLRLSRRRFRERQAEALLADAAEMPELLPDAA